MVKAGVDFTPRYEQWDDTPDLMGAIMAMDPTTPVMRAESEWTSNPYSNYERSHNNQEYNPVANDGSYGLWCQRIWIARNSIRKPHPIKGLTIKSAFGLNARFRRTDSFNVNFFIDNLEQNQNNNATRKMENSGELELDQHRELHDNPQQEAQHQLDGRLHYGALPGLLG